MRLTEALPELVADLESALLSVGRPDLMRQLSEAFVEHWSYDDFSDTTYLKLAPADGSPAERLSLYDELGVNVDCDERGRLAGLEILDGQRIAEALAAKRDD